MCLALLVTSKRHFPIIGLKSESNQKFYVGTSCYTLVRQVSSFKDSNLINPSALDLRTGI